MIALAVSAVLFVLLLIIGAVTKWDRRRFWSVIAAWAAGNADAAQARIESRNKNWKGACEEFGFES